MINTEKVDAKKRKVFRNSKGRTYVKQGDKKVFVKKLFTPKNIDFDEKPPKAQKKERRVSIRKPRTEAQAFADGVRIARARDGKAREYQDYVYDHWDRAMVESFDRGLNEGYGHRVVDKPETPPSPYRSPVVEMKSPSINTQKVNAKKRKVFRDTKGRTFVKQDGKKVYVKKLFTPK